MTENRGRKTQKNVKSEFLSDTVEPDLIIEINVHFVILCREIKI